MKGKDSTLFYLTFPLISIILTNFYLNQSYHLTLKIKIMVDILKQGELKYYMIDEILTKAVN